MKTHKIEKTKDIVKVVTEENIDGFLKDFEAWLRLVMLAKKAYGEGLVDSGFTWKDDGEYGKLTGVKTEIEFK